MFCRDCGSEISGEPSYCPHCGTELDQEATEPMAEDPGVEEKKSWYNRGGMLFLWALFLPPVFLYGLYRNEWMDAQLKYYLGWLIAALVGSMGLSLGLALLGSEFVALTPVMLIWMPTVLGFAGIALVGLFKPSLAFWWREEESVSRSRVFTVAASGFLLTLFYFPVSVTSVIGMVSSQSKAERYQTRKTAVLGVVDSLVRQEEPRTALDTIEQYRTSLLSQPTLDSLKAVARADTLYQKVLQIPASKIEKNIEAYRELTEIDSNRALFQQKLQYYRRLKKKRRNSRPLRKLLSEDARNELSVRGQHARRL